jgi:hypothetical protein
MINPEYGFGMMTVDAFFRKGALMELMHLKI